jgi:hypothetical protein
MEHTTVMDLYFTEDDIEHTGTKYGNYPVLFIRLDKPIINPNLFEVYNDGFLVDTNLVVEIL